MALAQRLNELAVANSEGLLNDDEYRLLRQNVFEQYSTNVVVPMEAPVVPIARVHVQVRSRSSPSPNQRRPSSKASPDQPLVRTKPTVTSGVANLFRKATGRRTPNSINDPTTTKDKDTRKANGFNHLNDTPKRSAMIPRLLHKKPAELPPLRTDTPRALEGVSQSPKLRASKMEEYHSSQPSVLNPSGSAKHLTPPASPFHPERSISTIRDVFDDENLITVKDIRTAIATTEDEARRLIDAFNNLEATTLRRIQKQNARRLPTSTPANINVLLEGREWREHRLISSPSSPLFDSKQRHILSSVESNSDGMSICSGSSNKTTLSQSRSISSLPKHASSSPLSPHFRIPSRKNSISSISSQVTSIPSSGMLSVGNPSSLSRSTSLLALRKLNESSGMISTETIGVPSPEEADDDSELSDIRKRREDLISRYTARLEFLRAKLKGAELREKLLRK